MGLAVIRSSGAAWRAVTVALGVEIHAVQQQDVADDDPDEEFGCGEGGGEAVVYSASGQELSREPLAVKDSAALVEAEIPPAGVLVVELEAPPWEVSSASRK